MARAKCMFTDRTTVSPFIETDSKDLFDRLKRASKETSPARAATKFLLITAATKRAVTVHNSPEGRTFGGTLGMIEGEGFWPGAGTQAGVFLVYLENDQEYPSVSFWGGVGFEDSPEFTAKIPQVLDLSGEPA